MWEELRALVVDQESGAAEALARALHPEIKIGEIEIATSTHHALQAMLESEYHICFVSDKLALQDATVFIRDVNKLHRKQECAFVQIRDSLPSDFDCASLQAQGFQCVISKVGTYKDKEGIKATLKEFLHGQEINKRVVNIDGAMKMALTAIDNAAEDVRRGRKLALNRLSLDYIANQTEFDQKVLTQYYETLEKKAEQALPAETAKLEVPLEILGRKLPHLKRNEYSGASLRVWKKLSRRYGKKH